MSSFNMETKEESDETLLKSLAEGTTLDASEQICTVSEHNIPTPNGHPRNTVRLNNLWHRATYIVIRHMLPSSEEEEHLIIQKRSKYKDYCPSKYDPCPGGLVGFNESYEENATREIQEEMGIDVVSSEKNTIRRVFTFPYEDSRCKCWGELYEVCYHGNIKDLTIQEEEVEEIQSLPLSQIQTMSIQNQKNWIPDGLYALKLYLQHRHDVSLQRKLLPTSSSGNLNAYGLRPKPQVLFFDCDDCLYFDNWHIAHHLTTKINAWCVEKAGLKEGDAYRMYKEHGTALKGLLAEGYIPHCEEAIDEYLEEVHDLPIDALLTPDEELRNMILKIDPTIPKFIFTASVKHHAERCVQALGIDDLFCGIIDVKACNLVTKHSREAFEVAMSFAGVEEPESCVFLDDSVKNIRAASEVGWRSILVGRTGRDCGKQISSEYAEHEIDRIHDFPAVFPELFTD